MKYNGVHIHEEESLLSSDMSQNKGESPSGHRQSKLLKCCPKLTRWKLLSISVVGVIASVFLYYSVATSTTKDNTTNSGMSQQKASPSRDPILDLPGDPSINRIRYKHTNRRLPQCVIIGARKGGTRALLTFLNHHTDIMAAKDEVHFFDREDNYSLGSDWYRRQMPYSFPGQVTIEKSPAYFHEQIVPERMHRFNSSIKLLLIVRDPVQRAISDYYQLYLKARDRGRNGHRFEDLVLNDYGDINASYDVLQRSMYFKHLKKWFKFFSPRQILIVHGEKFTNNPASELDKIEKFLGLESQLTADKFVYSETKRFYCYLNGSQEKCLGPDKGRKHPEIDPIVITKLYKFFVKYNKRFYKLTGRDFGWDKLAPVTDKSEDESY